MQYILCVLLSLPVLLHGYIILQRKSQLDLTLPASQGFAEAKSDDPFVLDSTTVVVKVDLRK
jgi:hypothetical protein